MMTNAEIERAYGQALVNGHSAALRAIFTIGFAKGAGKTIDSNLGDLARTSTAPTVVEMQTVTSHPNSKRPD